MSSYPFKIQEHVLPGQHIRRYPRATANDQHDVLQVVYKQYTPLDNPNPKPGDITIIGAHANGFPKELYEPLWEDIYHILKKNGRAIRNIWIADVAHQGASGVLNEGKLGNDPSWFDHPLDLLHMTNVFRNQMVRPIIGVGHSMGGNNLVNLALFHPRLIETLILIDPVIQRAASVEGNYMPARLSSRRREFWSSRAEAAEGAKKSKFYQTWDSRVLERWLTYGFRDLPTRLFPTPPIPAQSSTTANALLAPTTTEPTTTPKPEEPQKKPVTLTTTKHQEVFSFLRPNFQTTNPDSATNRELIVTTEGNRNRFSHPDMDPVAGPVNAPFYRPEPIMTFHRLPSLLPSVLYVFGEQSDLSKDEFRADKMAVTGMGLGGSGGAPEGRVVEVLMKDVGHLIPMEKPQETAEHSVQWLLSELRKWENREEQEKKEWDAVPQAEKSVLSKAYMEMLHSPQSPKKVVKL